MDKLEIPYASLVGHMDGSSIALMFGGLFPKRARAIVALAAYGFADDYLRTALNAIQVREDGPEWLSTLQGGGANPDALFRRWRENRLAECERRWSAIEFFDGITAPVLFVQGSRDEFVSAEQVASIAGRLCGEVSWVTLRNAGHLLHRESPQQVTPLIQRQLERFNPECVWQSQNFRVDGRDGSERIDISESESGRLPCIFGVDDGRSRLQIA
ncbi:Alpha/beta hydrolase family protein [compost metagenome]